MLDTPSNLRSAQDNAQGFIVWSKLRAVSPKAFIHKHRINAFALTGRRLRYLYTQGAATLCPGLIAGCPYRAWPTGTYVPQGAATLCPGLIAYWAYSPFPPTHIFCPLPLPVTFGSGRFQMQPINPGCHSASLHFALGYALFGLY